MKRKIESPRRRNSNFHSWVTRLPIEMNVHVVHIFWRLLQIPAFSLLPSKMTISNSSPLQGRRVNRLPCFSASSEVPIFVARISRKLSSYIWLVRSPPLAPNPSMKKVSLVTSTQKKIKNACRLGSSSQLGFLLQKNIYEFINSPVKCCQQMFIN